MKLAKKLDGLPLALATAGAYLKQVTTSFSDYLRLYEASWLKLQESSPRLTSYEDRTLYSTWQLSFNHVEQRNGLSAKLLRLWAYFDNQDLWFELLRHGDSEDPDWIRELAQDQLSFYGAVRVLSDHGLAEVATFSQELIESQGFSIHGCVHLWAIHVLNQEWDHDLVRVAVKFVGSHIPGEETVQPWLTQRRLLQHAARCSYILLNGLVPDESMAWIYHNLGDLYRDQDKLAEAEQMYQRALQGKEKSLGAEHILTLDTVHNLGRLYLDHDKLVEAEQMCRRALQGREKALGAEHKSTLDTVHNLGWLYEKQGKPTEAEQIYQQALQRSEKVLGAKHRSTLQTVNNLGALYGDQGKLAEAEQMYQRALQGRENALGAEHILTLETVHNLGWLYAEQRKLAEAEQMYQRALQGREKMLGAEHRLTLGTVYSLGWLYAEQCKLTKAERMY
jgi:tetratricopeptide (TPR) repeat protein